MAKASDELVKVAAVIASQNPVLWDRFVAALNEHYRRLADETVDAHPDLAHTMQGGARQARFLHDTMKTCRETALKLQKD
jgi:hypothetical protein